MKHMRTFGEMAVVAIHEGKKMRSKLDNRGKTCMFVGYADDHSGDVYRLLNIHTKRIIMSRDARWLNIIWKHYRMKSIYARKQVELFLDEEERSIEEDSEQEHEVVEEEETEGDGHNMPTQRKLGLDISMIGARKETLGKPGVRPRKCPHLEMSPWKEQTLQSDKETRISVFGCIIYFCGIPIAWRSKGMKSVLLSTTEAEYMALSEVVKELKFIVQLLQTMNVEVQLPIASILIHD